jgi:TonB family protein
VGGSLRPSTRRSRVLLALAVLLSRGPSALAQEPPKAVESAPPLTPPKAIPSGDVPYPEGAKGDAVVMVELVVDPTGAVKDARVVEGKEPFSTHALSASRRWRFVPAHRGEMNVAARVRMRIEFHEPVPVVPDESLMTKPVESQPPKPAPPPPEIKGVDEVQVRGARQEAGKTTVGGGEVRQVPGAFGDAFRMIEALPGVTPVISGLPFFFVRGAPPGNTGYYLDGVRLPLLYHLAAGPSIVHPGLIDRVDFYPGGFPARFGRFTGGILAGYTKAPAQELHGEWNLRLLDLGALVETPFAQGRGSLLVGGRYGYPGLVLSLISPDVRLSYWDYQARASWKLNATDTVSAFWFGSYDYLGEVKTDFSTGEKKTEQLFNTLFHRLDLRYDHELRKTGNVRLALTLGTDNSGGEDGDAGNKLVGLRAEIEDKLGPNVRARGGADVLLEHYDLFDGDGNRVKPIDGAASVLFAPRNDVTIGAHADLSWRVTPRVELIPGIRTDIFTSRRIDHPRPRRNPFRGTRFIYDPATAAVGVDPRLAARLTLTPKVTWVSTFGVSHQPPSFPVQVAGAGISRLRDGLQTSLQTSQGVEIMLPADFTATANVFLHDYIGITDATATCVGKDGSGDVGDVGDAIDDSCLGQRVNGRAVGMELLLKRSLTKRLTGWVSYTLSRTTRTTNYVTSQIVGGVVHPLRMQSEVLGEFDRPHVLNVIGAYDMGKGWRGGARVFIYSGRPYTAQHYMGVSLPPINAERMPPYYRLDIRLEKAWKIGKSARVSFIVEGLNVTLNKEILSYSCERSQETPVTALDQCEYQKVGPITIPSLGVEGSF